MPFDADLADRVRHCLTRRRDIAEKRMFGGLAFLLNGNLLVGVMHDTLIVRLGPAGEEALLEPHVRVFDFTGKAMSGWVVV
jgi:TfoX/Sxy family transcriptional regulator of competence genes